MTGLRQKVLFEQLKEAFITIQKSKTINKELGDWEERVQNMNDEETNKACWKMTKNIDKFIKEKEGRGKKVSSQEKKAKIIKELRSL